METLIESILKYARENNFDLVINNSEPDSDIDFININIKNKKVYIGELDISENITEVEK